MSSERNIERAQSLPGNGSYRLTCPILFQLMERLQAREERLYLKRQVIYDSQGVNRTVGQFYNYGFVRMTEGLVVHQCDCM